MDWMRWAATLAVVLASVLLYPVFAKLRRRRRQSRPDGIQVLSNPPDPKFDIVAVHGLGADPEYTWTCQAPAKSTNAGSVQRIHLLRDLLQHDFPEARILAFSHNSDWLIDAPVKTAQQIGDKLLEQLEKARSNRLRIPIIFIGHSFGGIIIKEALCKPGNDSHMIADDTCGIIFLGTPHQGSPVSVAGATITFLTGFLGSNTTLLLSLRNHQAQLTDLERRFRYCMELKERRRQKTEMISFCEAKPTYVLGWLSIGIVVTPDSAMGPATKIIPVDVDHSRLNKCSRRDDKLYTELRNVIKNVSLSGPTLNPTQQYVEEKLAPVKGAAFDSHADEHEARCHPGTRRDLLRDTDDWAHNPESKCIYWLQGRAGTGKSTISRTVAHNLAVSKRLGASFFFKRGEGDRGNAARFVATIAAQLVCQLPPLAQHVRNVIESKSGIAEKVIKEQFEKLILQPLEKVTGDILDPLTMVVVIDALDECDGEEDVRLIINLLSQAKSLTSVCLKFFITSRPELPIRLGFGEISGSYTDLVLHDIPVPVIEGDISAFLEFRLPKIRDEFNKTVFEHRQLPLSWPNQEKVKKLVKMSIPLFIFAATACRFIEDRRHGGKPDDKLEKILEYQTRGYESNLDATYLPALDQILLGLKDSARSNAIQEFKKVVGSIVVLASPLSAVSLGHLLRILTEDVESRLDLLHSVLNIPSDSNAPIRLFHLSFRDFLVAPDKRANDFWVDKREIHEKLTIRCLQLLDDHLTEDICRLQMPGKLRKDIDKQTIDNHISPEIRYACLYWIYHLTSSESKIQDEDRAHQFLRRHFLHWLEALSLIGRALESITIIKTLQSLVEHQVNAKLSDFLNDAMRLVLANTFIIDSTPLQIYSSVLAFTPQESKVRETFENVIPDWISLRPEAETNWNQCLQTFEGHSDWVHSVAFSHDSALVASASNDRTVRIWRTDTGEGIQELKGHGGWVYSVAFSHDSTLVASASDDKTVRIWRTDTGEGIQELKGHSDEVYSVAFSHDSALVASASNDETVRIWRTDTGEGIQELKGHSDGVRSVAFSHDSALVASTSDDRTVRIWRTDTGEGIQELKGHSNGVYSVAFSHDSALVASASSDKTARIWRTDTGECVQKADVGGKFSWLSFESDNSRLLTSAGAIIIGRLPLSGEATVDTISNSGHDYRFGYGFSRDLCWITWNGHNLLWLPAEFRPVKSAVSGFKVVIGCSSGRVIFLQFSTQKLPRLFI